MLGTVVREDGQVPMEQNFWEMVGQVVVASLDMSTTPYQDMVRAAGVGAAVMAAWATQEVPVDRAVHTEAEAEAEVRRAADSAVAAFVSMGPVRLVAPV